jgi:precorrin-8X/cobalt-precorrin-8 methylmutase
MTPSTPRHHENGEAPESPEAIYAESFRVIEAEVGEHGFDAQRWPIVRRMIHATGDLALADDTVFTHDATEAGLRACRSVLPVVTDVAMLEAGLQRSALDALGIRTACYIRDPAVQEAAHQRGGTRSRHAMRRAIGEHPCAVYAVGNAPTALLALCEAVEAGEAAPALILAMPVGFVSVARSKERALALPCPVIAVRGRKGGSAVAAAAMNAILRLALGEDG